MMSLLPAMRVINLGPRSRAGFRQQDVSGENPAVRMATTRPTIKGGKNGP